MFSQRAEDAQGNEISFPGKKVVEFVDFLRQIYPQFSSKLTTHNVGYIYALAKEFHVESVLESCASYHYAAVKNLTVKEFKNLEFLEDLDAKTLREILLPKAERLEECIVEIIPQLLGFIDYAVYLSSNIPDGDGDIMSGNKLNLCALHYDVRTKKAKGTFDTFDKLVGRLKCEVCVSMLNELEQNCYYDNFAGRRCHYSSSNIVFNRNIAKVFQEMSALLESSK
ncbi:hypothetical protein QZH41_008904 [Actinostola sp. cb2023]|nr:hypothetical protein QZH41_008904 [Actinostola sp. cb2023]